MTLINCCENCVYQNEGFCCLDSVCAVTNLSPGGCIHKLERTKSGQSICPEKKMYSDALIPQEPLPHHGSLLLSSATGPLHEPAIKVGPAGQSGR